MCDGVAQTPPAADAAARRSTSSPSAPGGACAPTTGARTWRASADDLRALGVVPRTTPAPLGSAPLPLRRARRGEAVGGAAPHRPPARPRSAARSLLVGGGCRGLALAARSRRRASPGRWRASIGKRARPPRATARSSSSRSSRTARACASRAAPSTSSSDPDWQKLPRVLAAAQRPAAQPRLLSRRRRRCRTTSDDARPTRRPGRAAILLSVHVDRARRRRPDRHRRPARHDRSRRQAHPRPPLAQQRAGRARRRPAPRALGSPARPARPAAQRAATVLPRACGGAGAGSLASAAPALPSTGRRFSRHSGMPPRNQ